MNKICVVCGKEFEVLSKQFKRLCCSEECTIARRKNKDKEKVSGFILNCKHCGKEFIGNKHNCFCSKDCRSAFCAENKKECLNTCIVCGKTFKSKRRDSKYCSRDCVYVWLTENKKHLFECKCCGKEFRTNDNKQMFCSVKCVNDYRREDGNLFKCEHCNKEFSGRKNHQNRFCCRECFLNHIGVEKWKYKKRFCDITHIRRAKLLGVEYEDINVKKVFQDNGYVCKLCGEVVDISLPYPNKMSASLDHIRPLSKGGTHTYNNVQLAHLGCNLFKSNKVKEV